jgi:hypothetical protein
VMLKTLSEAAKDACSARIQTDKFASTGKCNCWVFQNFKVSKYEYLMSNINLRLQFKIVL